MAGYSTAEEMAADALTQFVRRLDRDVKQFGRLDKMLTTQRSDLSEPFTKARLAAVSLLAEARETAELFNAHTTTTT